jgi:transposase-like protein
MLKLMRRIRRVRPALPPPSAFTGFRFPWEVIVLAVRWYLRYGLSYRDVEELLAERGVRVDHVTIYRGAGALRRRASKPPTKTGSLALRHVGKP